MPELPEVETLVRGLSTVLLDRQIADITINQPKMWHGESPDQLRGRHITHIARVAKLLVFTLTADLTLLIHLKMTGQLIFVDKAGRALGGGHPDDQFGLNQPSKFTHVTFTFADGSHLYFNDQRQFGYAQVIKTAEVQKHKFIASIGTDPFTPQFTPEFLFEQLQKRPRTTVKQVVMDQTVIAGIGNIYADESLFAAKILPSRKAASISMDEAKTLHHVILEVLKKAIEFGGTSYSDFVHHSGKKGTMQDHLMVYRRNGQPCKACGTIIKRVTISGRGTHFCPHCQK